ncbi:transposase [uncultured Roseobacter sp.]|uniref:REP-associated tyrosine transposase n=1 Tax=uncultured Roseobacter sp. TaxID=114847 RepID=UPI002621D58B|nr:transposase [uncultured Roseobacter sp.]
MTSCYHSKNPNPTYFFTARLADPNSSVLVKEVALLRQAVRETVERYPFTIDAIVVLPAALHTIWTLTAQDPDFRPRWRFLKSRFSRALMQTTPQQDGDLTTRRERIWHKRLWDHQIRSSHDLEVHRQLIHSAPAQTGLVQDPKDWAWTSLHRTLAASHRQHNAQPPRKLSDLNFKSVRSTRTVSLLPEAQAT